MYWIPSEEPRYLLAAKEKEERIRGEEMFRKHWPGAGPMASSVSQAWRLFEEWFVWKGGSVATFFESIDKIVVREPDLKDTLHQIRKLRNQLRHEQSHDEYSARRLIDLIHKAVDRRNAGGSKQGNRDKYKGPKGNRNR